MKEPALAAGIDAVSIGRILKASQKERFLSRVFTEKELRYCFGKKNPAKHLSGRFAAKEAFIKAASFPAFTGVRWKDVEVSNGRDGRPGLLLHGKAGEILKGRAIFLSIAYSKDSAFAAVAIQ